MNIDIASGISDKGYDALILGGGLAGLTLALQLARAESSLKIGVVERRTDPAPEALFKVGESTVEVAAHYLNEVLGLHDHLAQDQLSKMGLRYFFSGQNGNEHIEERFETGAERYSPFETYQLDRGRLENELMRRVCAAGVEVIKGSVRDVDINQGGADHEVTIATKAGEMHTYRTRWVADASGRTSLLKRKLDLDVPNKHDINAAWFRIDSRITIDDWSDDPAWAARVDTRTRWLSTNHLVGKGYWVWIIPLSSGMTSIGIVADPRFHRFDSYNTFAQAQQWLATHEPQLSSELKRLGSSMNDFHVMTHCAREAKRMFSSSRWALTGEAGCFLDPLYSPGSDFIAISNTFVADLILRDLKGEDLVQRTEYFNAYMQSIFRTSMLVYRDQYATLGNSRVMSKKIIWDTLVYWGTFSMIFVQDQLCNLDLLKKMRPMIYQVQIINAELQRLFKEAVVRDEEDGNPCRAEQGFLGMSGVRAKYFDLYQALLERKTPEEVLACLQDNLRTLEQSHRELKEELTQNLPFPLAVLETPPLPFVAEEAMAGAAS